MCTKYNKAVYRTILHWDGLDRIEEIERISKECNELILVIPDKWIYARIYGGDEPCQPEHLKELWSSFPFISEVVIIDIEHMTLPKLKELVDFDTLFVGNDYGQNFISDQVFCTENGINIVSLEPDYFSEVLQPNALEIALRNVPCTKKIVCFGTGLYFNRFMESFGEKYVPAYAIDNDESKWGTMVHGIQVFSPNKLLEEPPKDVLVILCTKKYDEPKEQLLSMGKYNYRTLLYNNNIALLEEFLIDAREEEEYMVRAMEILKKMMKEFDRVCQKYSLRYYVISGSLIGVVRHHGMIPWDDDMDVGMPREDFEKFKEIAANEWDGKEYLFVDYDDLGNDTFHDLMPRIYYMKEKLPTKIMDKSRGKMAKDLADRLILDIYPMDNASDNPKKHSFNMLRLKGIYNLLMGHRGYIDYEEYSKLSSKTVMMIKFINNVGRLIPFKILIKWMDKSIRCENRHETSQYFMSSGPIYYVERVYDKKFFGEGQLMEFEDMKIRVPLDYDGLLHAQNYGNYMDFPPYAMRKPSHYFNADISIW